MRRFSLPARLGALILVAMAIATTVVAVSDSDSTARFQAENQFQLFVDDAVVESADETVTVTVSIAPGDTEPSAVRARVTFDSSILGFQGCTNITAFASCVEESTGVVLFESVTGSAWTEVSPIIELGFRARDLREPVTLELAVEQGLDFDEAPLAASAANGQIGPLYDGDANCSGRVDITDAMVIAQYDAGIRKVVESCASVEPSTELNEQSSDFNGDGSIDVVDALFIAQCAANLLNEFCPG